MTIETLLLYTIVSFFYIISPGPAVFLAIANGMGGNLKSVMLSSFGNILGLFLLSSISIVGLGALILASSTLFFIVKITGAAYLIFLGIKQFRIAKSLGKLNDDKNNNKVNKSIQKSDLSTFTEGFFLAATNPKPILFFIAIFPQFLNIDVSLVPQFFTLTFIFMFISFFSLFGYGFLAKSMKSVFSNTVRMKWFHRITGGLFISMGIGLLQLDSGRG